MEEGIKLGKYKHFKGGEYDVIGVARHSETFEKLVIYKALYKTERYEKGQIWARPLAMFMALKNINGEKYPRFVFIK